MPRSSRWLFPLCLASLLWSFQFGVNAPLASLWMERAGCSDSLIGQNTGVYYLGIAAAAIALPRLLRRFGRSVLLVGMAASAVSAAAFPWGGGLFGWFGLRAVNGVAAAMSLIPLETYVNRNSDDARRALNFGMYAFCVALGMALGYLFAIPMEETFPTLAFVIGGAGALAAGVVVLVWRPVVGTAAEESQVRTPLHLCRNFLAFGSGWSQGFMEGCLVAMLPIYLVKAVGLSRDTVGCLMGGLMMGVILAQGPLAWLADRLGRTMVLASCNVTALIGVCCLSWPGGLPWLAFWLFVVGACSGAFYPLGLALLGERTPPEGMSRAGSWFLAINSLGSMTGPVVAGYVNDWFGRKSLFVTGCAALSAVLAIWVLLSVWRRPHGPAIPLPHSEAEPSGKAA
jgi:MFS family permease